MDKGWGFQPGGWYEVEWSDARGRFVNMGYDHYAHSWDYAYEARRMWWKPWRWEVFKYNKIDNEGKRRKVGEVYVRNLTKLGAEGFVKLLTEV